MKKKSLFILSAIILLSGCDSSQNNKAPIANDMQWHVQVNQIQEITLNAYDPEGDEILYEFVTLPKKGVASLTNSKQGHVRFLSSKMGEDQFQYRVFDRKNYSNIATVKVIIPQQDPLFEYQWYLKNSGQKVFSSLHGQLAEDIRMQDGGEKYTGKGITIAIIDQGLEIQHEDLKHNVVSNGSYNFNDQSHNPTSFSQTGDHGTSVAGLIAAESMNGLGIRGVAPNARLKAFNFIASDTTEDKHSAAHGVPSSFIGLDATDVDIFNKSYGSNPIEDIPVNPLIEASLVYGTSHLRKGRGAIYVKAVGNEFHLCGNTVPLPCFNTNMEPESTLPYQILVGALNSQGIKASYSNTGSSLFISAPGGENGVDAPAIMTTDQSGCDKGYGVDLKINEFEFQHTENINCNYTSSFGGTSAAAPIVSGVIALLLEANPKLSWRDIKHILANTARQVDTDNLGVKLQLKDGLYQAELGWISNSAGYHFHNAYGFGAIWVDRAIKMAEQYLFLLGNLITTPWLHSTILNAPIPDASIKGTSHTLNVTDNLVIEAVQVQLSANHTYVGDLGIELTSPSGTQSILLNINNGFAYDQDLNHFQMLSYAFYGEQSLGNWKVRVIDGQVGDNGVLTQWSIRFYGHQ